MDETTKTFEIAKLARHFGLNEADNRLIDDYEDALIEALSYCNRDVVVNGMLPSVRDLAKIRYNMRGSEGESSRSEGSVSHSFEEGIPKRIKSTLNRYRVAKLRSLL